MTKQLPPLHPGEVLREEFLRPLSLAAYTVAKACGVPRTRLERIVREEVGITADTALRLAKYFATTPEFWLNLQTRHDVETRASEIAGDLQQIRELESA
jgi:addiction module HigA family antidote